jgi:hypothetical protein
VTTTKPYLFLDFDGVLNYRRLPFREYLVEVESSEMPRHAFINTSSGEVATFTVRIPNAYPSWLAELSTRYELAWATTWETLANTYLAPLLGLDDDLPVVEFSKHPPSLDQIQRDEIAEWKSSSTTRPTGSPTGSRCGTHRIVARYLHRTDYCANTWTNCSRTPTRCSQPQRRSRRVDEIFHNVRLSVTGVC